MFGVAKDHSSIFIYVGKRQGRLKYKRNGGVFSGGNQWWSGWCPFPDLEDDLIYLPFVIADVNTICIKCGREHPLKEFREVCGRLVCIKCDDELKRDCNDDAKAASLFNSEEERHE